LCTILAIESSCDDTSAAIIRNGTILSNIVSSQLIHTKYGGVVPELASRAHQGNIVPVVDSALSEAKVSKNELDAIAFTQGPGLMGSLLVGNSFAKAMALGLDIPLITIDHLHAHLAAHFIERADLVLPMLCLLVSGGHTMLIKMNSPLEYEVLGRTTDDAAGEAFDKAAKIMGLPYPGGPLVDKYAKEGNPFRFEFPEPQIPGFDFSFSGLKTSFMYFLQKQLKENPAFIDETLLDLCASIQHRIVTYLINKLEKAQAETGIQTIGLAGGVAANSYLRNLLATKSKAKGWQLHIPTFAYCTDNAAMVAMAAHFKYKAGLFSGQDAAPYARGLI
jgi:N6-L-threonylcarbamoyladenine synthase